MGKGRRYELDWAASVDERTGPDRDVLVPDHSGSARVGGADVVVIGPSQAAYIELKKRTGETGNRTRVAAGSSDGNTGVDEIAALVETTPPWAMALFGVSWDHRQLRLFQADELLLALRDDATPDKNNFWDARVTRGGNISMTKPSTDAWPSATAGDDVDALLDTMGWQHPDDTDGGRRDAEAD